MTLSVLVLVIVLLGIALLSGIKNVEIPESMQRAIAKEAEAMRKKRARLIKATAELKGYWENLKT